MQKLTFQLNANNQGKQYTKREKRQKIPCKLCFLQFISFLFQFYPKNREKGYIITKLSNSQYSKKKH